MRTIHKYITVSFVTSVVSALIVFTFVMSLGVIFRIIDLLARGISWQPIMRILVSGIPAALGYSIPMSILTASLLVFGRLSSDGEITAMKACGVNMWQIIRGPVVVAIAATLFCLYIQDRLAPRSHFARRDIVSSLTAENPLDLLEEGRFIQDFEGLTIYFAKREGNILHDVRIYDLRKENFTRELRAEYGEILTPQGENALVFLLYDVRIDPFSEERPGAGFVDRFPLRVENAIRKGAYRPQEEDLTMAELWRNMKNVKKLYPGLKKDDRAIKKMSFLVEFHKRLSLASACFAFLLLGVPLGIKVHRKESSAGAGISLLLVFNFYLFIITGESLVQHPETFPYVIVWMPVAISVAIGCYLIHRSE